MHEGKKNVAAKWVKGKFLRGGVIEGMVTLDVKLTGTQVDLKLGNSPGGGEGTLLGEAIRRKKSEAGTRKRKNDRFKEPRRHSNP